jgi:hypothetical protein
MEKFQELREIAWKKAEIAEHMLTQTYPIMQDPKLLLAVLDNIFLSLTYAMDSILQHQRLFKKIPNYLDNFDAKLAMFQMKIVGPHRIEKKYITLMEEIKEILLLHKRSPIEFTRKDKIVICENNYEMKTLSVEDIRNYINKTKEIVGIAEKITKKDEEIFKRGMSK